jgi:hypothetical protein
MANRAQYPEPVKQLVKRKYHLCKSRADRESLTLECDALVRKLMPEATHPPMTLQKLYNLASRLEATRGHANSSADWSDGSPDDFDPKSDLTRLTERDDPDLLEWTASDDRYLREHWRATEIEYIAYYLNRTETAVAYRARQLSLRNVPKYYDAAKVAPWLGLNSRQLTELLPTLGLELFPCCDRDGKPRITLVSTTSLARVLITNEFWKTLIDKRNADRFFIKDIIESMVALQDDEASWEPNLWVSHGHTSLNPFSEDSFGLFFDGYDRDMPACGYDLDPRDLHPDRDVASDHWRRGSGTARIATIPVKLVSV